MIKRVLEYSFRPRPKEEKPDRVKEGEEMVQDPHCKVYVPADRAVVKKIGGERVYFCSEECAKKYVKDRG